MSRLSRLRSNHFHRTMIFQFVLASALLLVGASSDVNGQVPRIVYDATRLDSAKPRSARSDEALFKQQILPAARRAWRSRQKECSGGWEGEPEIRGVASGSFTKRNANQKAILYNFCTPAHAYAFNGVAIIEAGRVIVHLVYQSDWQNDIAAAPDVNGNGLNELILVAGTTNQGITWATITLIELGAEELTKFGYTEVFSDSCGNDEKSGIDAARIRVASGANPTFYKDSFRRRCNQKQWRRVKLKEEIQLEEDVVEYRKVN